MSSREPDPDPDIANVQRLRDRLAVEARVAQQRLEGVELALRLLTADNKESADQ